MFKNIIWKIKYKFEYWRFKYFGFRPKIKYRKGEMLRILPGDFDGDPIVIKKRGIFQWLKKVK